MTDLAEAIGDDLAEQVDVLFGDIDLPTASNWVVGTCCPRLQIVAEVGRLQGEDLLGRLPAWVPDQPASLLGGIGDGLVEISDSIQAFQDTYLEPEALVARVNALFRAADLPFELMHSEIGEEGEEMDMEHRWELAPTEELHLTRQFSLDASGFTQALAGNGSQVGTVLEDILGLTLGELTADFEFDLAAAGSVAMVESCEQGIRLVDTAANPELAVLWPAFDEPHFFSFTLPGEATPSLLDQELAIASALRLSELSFSTPLLTDEEGIPRVYQLSEIGDQGQTFGLRLGMGLDLFDDADAELDDSVPLADAPAPQLQGGTTLDLSETDLLALASAFGDDIRAAGLALRRIRCVAGRFR